MLVWSQHVLNDCPIQRGIYSSDFCDLAFNHVFPQADLLSLDTEWVREGSIWFFFVSMTTDGATNKRKGHHVFLFLSISSLTDGVADTLFGAQKKPPSPSICWDLRSLNVRDEVICTPPKTSPFLFPLFILLQFYQDSSMELWPLLCSSVTSCSVQSTAGNLWSLSSLTLNNFPFI